MRRCISCLDKMHKIYIRCGAVFKQITYLKKLRYVDAKEPKWEMTLRTASNLFSFTLTLIIWNGYSRALTILDNFDKNLENEYYPAPYCMHFVTYSPQM